MYYHLSWLLHNLSYECIMRSKWSVPKYCKSLQSLFIHSTTIFPLESSGVTMHQVFFENFNENSVKLRYFYRNFHNWITQNILSHPDLPNLTLCDHAKVANHVIYPNFNTHFSTTPPNCLRPCTYLVQIYTSTYSLYLYLPTPYRLLCTYSFVGTYFMTYTFVPTPRIHAQCIYLCTYIHQFS